MFFHHNIVRISGHRHRCRCVSPYGISYQPACSIGLCRCSYVVAIVAAVSSLSAACSWCFSAVVRSSPQRPSRAAHTVRRRGCRLPSLDGYELDGAPDACPARLGIVHSTGSRTRRALVRCGRTVMDIALIGSSAGPPGWLAPDSTAQRHERHSIIQQSASRTTLHT